MSRSTFRQPPTERREYYANGRGGGDDGTRTPRPAGTSAVYWRRRFIALVIGLVVLAVVAWALNGAVAGPAPAANTSALNATTPQPSVATTPSGAASQSGTTGPAGRAAGASHSPSASASASSHAATAKKGPRPCVAADIVLSLFSVQASYSPRQTPQFNIDVVSTARKTCTFDIGAKHLLLQIMRGTKQIWSSADCAEGQASLTTRLHRGVPTVVPITWNGQRSRAGCPVPGAAASAGNYAATAIDRPLASNTLVFRLG